MSFCYRRGALSRVARHLDQHLHDHHAASYYSLFRPTTYTSYTLTPFNNSPAEDLFRQFQPLNLNRFFRLWDNSWQEGEKENNNNRQQSNTQDNKENSAANSSSSTSNSNNTNSLQPQRHRHHLHRYRHPHSHHHPFDALANFWSPFGSFPAPSIVPSITLNLYSTPTSYQIQAELPGVKKDEIVISVEKGTLTIEAEKKEERGNKSNNVNNNSNIGNVKAGNAQMESNNPTSNDAPSSTSSSSSSLPSSSSSSSSSPSSASAENEVEDLYVESHYGKVTRSVSLPDDAAFDGLTAKYEDGVIKIEIPRKQIPKEEKKIVQLQ